MEKVGMLIDTTLCIGCYACEDACAERWGFPMTPEVPHELSAIKNTAVQQWGDVYVPQLCMHCEEPTCASVCPVGALRKTDLGPVIYDSNKCIGCRYCMQACPFQVPKYQWNKLNPKIMKCDMCYPRIQEGKPPACVEACPVQARIFGPREDLLQEAYKRIRENSGNYYPRIYGVQEAGGTSILFLANKPFQQLGFKTNLPQHPLPLLTWNVMSKIPNYVFWAGTLLGGIWWITKRREEVRRYEQKPKKTNEQNHG
ncbi:MAG: 4Fe-4S dicluster domain-containing protein [Bacteroidota bacterium]